MGIILQFLTPKYYLKIQYKSPFGLKKVIKISRFYTIGAGFSF